MDLSGVTDVENGSGDDESVFYKSAAKYWSQIPATVDGMLGGFGFISLTDINGSENFLSQLFKKKNAPGQRRAVDCGAGIGRITKNLLMHFFDEVDLVEQNPVFLEEAKNFIGPTKKNIRCFNTGLQHFSPRAATYDVIWCQWVLGHLTDDDLVDFFKACIRGLKPDGVIVIKENMCSTDKVEVDQEDSSVTRPINVLKDLFAQGNLRVIKEQKQRNFPRALFEVRMFALKPANRENPRMENEVKDLVFRVSEETVDKKLDDSKNLEECPNAIVEGNASKAGLDDAADTMVLDRTNGHG